MDGTPTTSLRILSHAAAGVLATLLALLALAATARAQDAVTDPEAHWPADGAAMHVAFEVAQAHWGATACAGDVGVLWEDLGPGINAQSSWSNSESQYERPDLNEECEISLSTSVSWTWVKLCTVVVHELGHLTGHDHADDPTDVMYPAYVLPLDECEATPEPVVTPAPAAPAPAASARRTAARTAPSSAGTARATATKRAAARTAKRARARAKQRRRAARRR